MFTSFLKLTQFLETSEDWNTYTEAVSYQDN